MMRQKAVVYSQF